MAIDTPAQRALVKALFDLKTLQDNEQKVIRTDEIDRGSREALIRNGFLRMIIKGWYMPSRPDESDGDSTAWYASAMEFVERYCESRFENEWCVSPDFSVRLHAGNPSVPKQVQIHAPKGQNNPTQLPAGHSILDYRVASLPTTAYRTAVGKVRAMTLEYSLTRVPESFFQTYAVDAQIALTNLKDASELTKILVSEGQPVVAGRLAGALRACKRDALADEVMSTMRAAGYGVTESNPFLAPLPSLSFVRGESPYVTRIRLMWQKMREAVIAEFPAEPGLPTDPNAYMAAVQEGYVRDAYNSLSIEGYRVTTELIERVARGDWSPDGNSQDLQSRDAMAARGYFLARKGVEDSIRRVHAGENAGTVLSKDHRNWYRELFGPSVDAGILKASDLAGYRGHQVFIKNVRCQVFDGRQGRLETSTRTAA